MRKPGRNCQGLDDGRFALMMKSDFVAKTFSQHQVELVGTKPKIKGVWGSLENFPKIQVDYPCF